MGSNKKRKEILLDEDTLELLEFKAQKAGRNLKNYMEFVLREDANAVEFSEGYTEMMDKMIDNHNQGKTTYMAWSTVKEDLL